MNEFTRNANIFNEQGLGNVYPESLLLGGAVIKGTGQALGVLGGVGNSVLNLTPQSLIVGGGIGGGFNAAAQYWINDGKIDWGNVGITAGVGALTYGTGFLYTVGANGAAGGYMNYRQGSSVVEGALIGGVSAGIGWGVGTFITNGFNSIFNPIRNSYTFYPPAAGSYFLQTPAISPVPNILSTKQSKLLYPYSTTGANREEVNTAFQSYLIGDPNPLPNPSKLAFPVKGKGGPPRYLDNKPK
jgi:hypothetical protein